MTDKTAYHAGEPHLGMTGRLNWLRAGVLGANDGIVSTAALVVGVAGATSATAPILTAGVAGLLAGAVSMALGEYVSVSSQRDAERSLLEKERRELEDDPEAELEELTRIYENKGLSRATAAWGSPASVLLHCGVPVPGPTTERCISIDEVDWVEDASDEPIYTYTSYGRDPATEVPIDSSLVSASTALTELTPAVAALPAQGGCVGAEDVD